MRPIAKEKTDPKLTVPTQKLLTRVSDYYHSALKDSKEGRAKLKELDLDKSGVIEPFKIGYCDNSLFNVIPTGGKIIKTLKDLNILKENGEEYFKGCITAPVFDGRGNTINIVGLDISTNKEITLNKEGIFNRHILKSYDEIVLTDSILEALQLYSKGTKNVVTLFKGNITEEDIQIFKEFNTKSVTYRGQSWEVDRLCTEKGNNTMRKIEDGFTTEICKRKYIVRGISKSPKKLKVNIKAISCNKFHIDTIDLYSSKSRQNFIKEVSFLFHEDIDILRNDIKRIIELSENFSPEDKKPEASQMSDKEREEAMSFGKNKELLDLILDDITKCGYVMEDTNKLISYIAMTSRKMEDPLSILIISGSSAGKSSLQDTILSLCPKEDVLKLTALTGRALFYKQETSLHHKVLAIEEAEGALQADYAIRNLITSKELSIEATVRDFTTGKMTTMENTVKGPTSVFKTTTNPETDPETKSRFITISIDESREQTRRILKFQRGKYTLEGWLKKRAKESVIRKHHNFQRLLEPVLVFNPYAEKLSYLDDRILVRRENPKYLTLINAIAFLHQMQRPIREIKQGNKKIRFIEVRLNDIAVANMIADSLFGISLEDLTAPSRALLGLIENMVEEVEKKTSQRRENINFTRREIREYTKWSDYQVHTHLKQLVDLEYLLLVSGKNGLQYKYELVYSGEGEDKKKFVLGLKDISILKKETADVI